MGLAAPLARHRLRLPRPVVSAVAWQGPFALAMGGTRRAMRDVGGDAVQMAAYMAH